MGLLPGDELVPAPAMAHQRNEVRLRARWQEQARLLPHQPGHPRLERCDRRVLAIDIVAHFGRCHRGAHSRAGAGDGIGTEIVEMDSQGALATGWVIEAIHLTPSAIAHHRFPGPPDFTTPRLAACCPAPER